MSATLRRTIFAACRDLGLDDDARHDLQLRVTGKDSLSDMTDRELRLVVDEMTRMGFRLARGGRHKRAPRADLRLVHVLWRKLGEADALEKPGRDGLNAFIRAQFGEAWGAVPADIDMLRDAAQINAVVCALKGWCARAGIELDR